MRRWPQHSASAMGPCISPSTAGRAMTSVFEPLQFFKARRGACGPRTACVHVLQRIFCGSCVLTWSSRSGSPLPLPCPHSKVRCHCTRVDDRTLPANKSIGCSVDSCVTVGSGAALRCQWCPPWSFLKHDDNYLKTCKACHSVTKCHHHQHHLPAGEACHALLFQRRSLLKEAWEKPRNGLPIQLAIFLEKLASYSFELESGGDLQNIQNMQEYPVSRSS